MRDPRDRKTTSKRDPKRSRDARRATVARKRERDAKRAIQKGEKNAGS